jgi:hypothetical protein
MYWDARPFRWLKTSPVEFEANLRSLVDENPLIASNGSLRPCGRSGRELRSDLWNSIATFAIDNFRSLQSYQSDQAVQDKLEREITKHLAERHYEFALKSSLTSHVPVTLRHFWWVASFYACRKETVGATTRLVMHYLDSIKDGRSFFGYEFYDLDKRRHSALVSKIVGSRLPGERLYLMVPFSHSKDRNGGNVEVFVMEPKGRERKFAQCRSFFYVNGAMLGSKYTDPLRMTIPEADFKSIVVAVDKLLDNAAQ